MVSPQDMLASSPLALYLLLLGPWLQFVSASWSIWPMSWSPSSNQVGKIAHELHCQRARRNFAKYCKEGDALAKRDVYRTFLSCFLNEAGRKLEWDEWKDFEDLEGKGSTILSGVQVFVDMLCSKNRSTHENTFSWFDGDADFSRSLQNLSSETQSILEEGKRVRKLFADVFDTVRSFNGFKKDLLNLKDAYVKANASNPRVPDFDIVHDELWIMVQDTVDLFDSHLHMISYFKNSLKDDLKYMKEADKTLRDVQDLSLFWRSYARRIEKLSEEAVRNKNMRTKVLYPWLFKEKRTLVTRNRSLSEATRRRKILENMNSELRERFRFKPRTLFWVAIHNMELFFRMYIRFAFDRLLKNVLESSSLPNWMLLASSLLAHLFTTLSVIVKLSFWLAKRGISLFLFLAQLTMPRFFFSVRGKGQRQAGYLQNAIRKCVKEILENESERADVQMMLETTCQRELDLSISRLLSVERRMLTLKRELNTLRDRAESLQNRSKEADK